MHLINTVTGLIFHELGAFPKVGEKMVLNDFDLIVEQIEGAKVALVRLEPH